MSTLAAKALPLLPPNARTRPRISPTMPRPPPPNATVRPLTPRRSCTCDGSSFDPGSKLMGSTLTRTAHDERSPCYCQPTSADRLAAPNPGPSRNIPHLHCCPAGCSTSSLMPGNSNRGLTRGNKSLAPTCPGICCLGANGVANCLAKAPDLLHEHHRGQGHHPGHVHQAHCHQYQHHAPAAADAITAVVGADPDIPQRPGVVPEVRRNLAASGSAAGAGPSAACHWAPFWRKQPWRAQDHGIRTSSIWTGRCSRSDSVQASATQPVSTASRTVQGDARRPATTSVNAVSSA